MWSTYALFFRMKGVDSLSLTDGIIFREREPSTKFSSRPGCCHGSTGSCITSSVSRHSPGESIVNVSFDRCLLRKNCSYLTQRAARHCVLWFSCPGIFHCEQHS